MPLSQRYSTVIVLFQILNKNPNYLMMFSQINVLRLLMTVNFGQISNHGTDRCLSSVTFSTGDICKIIQNLSY